MRGRGRGVGPAIGAGGVVGVPLGLWAFGPAGGLVAFLVWSGLVVVVRLGPAVLAHRTVHELGPTALASGGEIDVSCDGFEVHLRSGAPHESSNDQEANS